MSKVYNYIVDFRNGFGKVVSYNSGTKEECLIYYLDDPWLDVPEPTWEEESEEFRTFIPELDDSQGRLLHNISKIYSATWNYPYRDSYRLASLWYTQGWKLKDLLRLSPLEAEFYLGEVLSPAIISMLEEKVENGEIELDEAEALREEIKNSSSTLLHHPITNEFVIYAKTKNFTGEIRLTQDSESEEEKTEEAIDYIEFRKCIKNIILCFSGKLAYEASLRAKKLARDARDRALIRKAWEVRRSLPENTPLDERLKAARKLFT